MELGGDGREAVAHGLALLAAGMEELLCASATPLGTAELVAVLRGMEVATRKAAALSHQVLAQCAEQGTAITLGHRRLDVLLHEVLRISKAEARARVRAAEVCGPRHSFTGQPLEPVHPHTAAAAHVGLIGAEHTRIISQILGKIPHGIGAAGGGAGRGSASRVRAEHGPGAVGGGGAAAVGAPEPRRQPHRRARPATPPRSGVGPARGGLDVGGVGHPDPCLPRQAGRRVRETGLPGRRHRPRRQRIIGRRRRRPARGRRGNGRHPQPGSAQP